MWDISKDSYTEGGSDRGCIRLSDCSIDGCRGGFARVAEASKKGCGEASIRVSVDVVHSSRR